MKLVFLLGLLLLLPLIIFVTQQQQEIRQRAQEQPIIYLVPSTQSADLGESISVDVRVKSSEFPISAASLALSYPVHKIEVSNINTATTQFEIENERITSNGLLRLTRESATPKNGILHFATIEFLVKDTINASEFGSGGQSSVINSVTNSSVKATVLVDSDGRTTRSDEDNASLPAAILGNIISFFAQLNPFADR